MTLSQASENTPAYFFFNKYGTLTVLYMYYQTIYT